jgi:hypothetical protein
MRSGIRAPVGVQSASVSQMLGTRIGFRVVGLGMAALDALLSPAALYAQGCALCYQSAAGAGPRFVQALRHGILIMFFPPLLIMGAILFAAYRKRNQFNGDDTADPSDYGLDEPASSPL